MSINPFDSADKVNAVIKIRRGPESDRINSIYDSGELIYTTDKKRVYVGDGIDASGTYGGNIIGNKAWITDNFAKLNNIEIGDTVYRTDTSAYYVLTASAYILESSYALVGGNELINRNTLDVTVPKATKSTLGIIKVGVDLDIAGDGTLNLPKATASVLGGVKAGTGLSVAGDGTLSVTGGSTYTLSAATNSTLGGVKVGIGLSADNTGKLSLSAIPQTASTGQVLTWNGTKWIASDPTGGTNGDSVPIGSVIYFAASANIPTDYLPCDGRAVNRSYYADLDSVIYCGDANNSNVKTIFGYRCTLATSPDTTRNTLGQYIVLPDLRGEFIRGWDNGRGIDTGRKFGTYQVDDFRSHRHYVAPEYAQDGTTDGIGLDSSNIPQPNDIYTDYTGGSETRPRNIALVACIKVLKTGAPSVINYIPKPATATNGQVLTYQNSTNSWVASAVSGSSSSITLGTAVTLTNQTSVDFTGIPNTAKRVVVMVAGISTTGAGTPVLQVGSGSIVTSGYLGSVSNIGTGVKTDNFSDGFQLEGDVVIATSVWHGKWTLEHMGSNTWVCTGTFGRSNTFGATYSNGSITLASNLDRCRLTINGTKIFDAGTTNIMWE